MRVLLARVCLVIALALPAAAQGATPPAQPKSGPGGADYVASEVTKRAVGTASAGTYVFHAPGAADAPRPVAVLLHAWGAVNPQVYGGLIDHMARKGYLVLYPRFQEVGRTRPADATGLAARLVREAFAVLETDAEARPDKNRVVFVGHSAGAAVAINLAALAPAEDLPAPKLVLALMPGGIAKDAKSRGIPLSDLSVIDPATLLVTMNGDRDFRAADLAARRILREAVNVPADRKLFMRVLSDDHGFPALSATLASPGSTKDGYDGGKIKLPPDPPVDPKAARAARPKWSPDMALSGEQTVLVAQLGSNVTDTLDYLGYWKTLELAAAAGFSGKDAQALRNDPALSDMGRWSDGWPVKRLVVEIPKVEVPKAETPKAEAPKAEAPKAASAGRRR